MTTQTITLRLTADTKGLVSEVKVVGAEVKKLGRDGADPAAVLQRHRWRAVPARDADGD